MRLSLPVAYKTYVQSREHHCAESRVYDKIAEHYNLEAWRDNQETAHAFVQFPHEPCECIAELLAKFQRYPSPLYFICCYAAYPLSNKINAALYMHKEMGLSRSQPVSFSDTGSLSPLVALQWAEAVQADVWMACIEQIAKYHTPMHAHPSAFPKADALTLTRLSPNEGDWQIISYGMEQFDDVSHRLLKQGGALTHKVRHLIDDVLETARVAHEEALIVPQTLDPLFLNDMKAAYPMVYLKIPAVNLCTADAFYALADLHEQGHKASYVLLNFTDPAHGMGCILLRREKTG
jgi:hypothetical protein